jgi:hypothetical protein
VSATLHTGEALRQFGLRMYLEAAGDWLERGAVAAIRRGPKGSGIVVATLQVGLCTLNTVVP